MQALPDFTDSTTKAFSKSYHPSGFISKLANNLGRGFLGYDGQNSSKFNGEGIVDSNGNYKSAYHDCNWEQDYEAKYAKIFLVLSCLVYYFITFLYWMCNKNSWKHMKIESRGSNPLFYLMLNMGYSQPELNEKKTGAHIADRLTVMPDGFSELEEAYESGAKTSYDAFLTSLNQKASENAINCPLTNCKIFSYAYLQSRQNGKDITAAIDAVKGTLVTLSKSSDTSSTNEVSALKDKIGTLLEKIKTFNLNPGSTEPGSDGLQKAGSSGNGSVSSSQSSSAGPAVGGLVGVGALGAGAAYFLNIGGAKTLVNGLLRIG
ncbi:variant erythrocyte surface antigen-1 family protein [Babesia caballi]|uniref:Variant erythrocyte surface antigen-1 family protein n=1 Tax=Babesia caballi TaxID=5871 RepID=A0AAV4LSE2_BABCB|nr:variant erythrocyte surface antigen-1 family protein [Babesia caballi]